MVSQYTTSFHEILKQLFHYIALRSTETAMFAITPNGGTDDSAKWIPVINTARKSHHRLRSINSIILEYSYKGYHTKL